MNPKFFIYFSFFLLFSNLVNPATIYGTIYDLSLTKVGNARVEINTSPRQFVIAQNGSYSFNVPNGDYKIKAQLLQKGSLIASSLENITVKQDGSYVLDLILFPNIEEGIEDIDIEVDKNLIGTAKNNFADKSAIVLLILAVSGTALAYYLKNKQKTAPDNNIESKTEDNDVKMMIKIIKQEGGRTTQKELRRQIPLSEAKISLMIAELEHKGVIEKIKKGRGNIIILKRK